MGQVTVQQNVLGIRQEAAFLPNQLRQDFPNPQPVSRLWMTGANHAERFHLQAHVVFWLQASDGNQRRGHERPEVETFAGREGSPRALARSPGKAKSHECDRARTPRRSKELCNLIIDRDKRVEASKHKCTQRAAREPNVLPEKMDNRRNEK